MLKEKNNKLVLDDEILNEFKKRKRIEEKDSFRLKLRTFIEIQAIDRVLLEQQLDKISDSIKNDEEFTIYDLHKESIIEKEGMYSSFIDITLTVKNFQALVKFIIFYGPTTIEVIKPSRIEFSAFELQEGILDLLQMNQKYTEYILKLMNRKELEEFNRQLLKKK